MTRVAVAIALLYAPAPRQVQFNCPWCTTRLELPEHEFTNERAVLCPRCNNPIDLAVQRRLSQQPPPAPPAPQRRQVTVPPPAAPPPVSPAAPPGRRPPPPPRPEHTAGEPLPPLDRTNKRHDSRALDFDPDKPIDIDAAFQGEPIHVDDIESLMSTTDLWRGETPRGAAAPTTPGAPGQRSGAVVMCPACKYENAPVPAGFEFGKVRKCTWCGKPLPQ
jgi:hypothetical protein